jgi:hypothetical protein
VTALDAYARLEAEGRYRARPDATAEAVVVSFGEASLTVLRFDDTPLAHWPIASVAAVGGGGRLTLAPDAEAPERLEIDDADMIAAIRAVRPEPVGPPAPRRRRRWPGRLAMLAAAALVGWGAWTQAPKLVDPIAGTAPAAARAALGAAAIRAYAGERLCSTPAAEAALRTLARRFRSSEPDAQTALWVAEIEGEAVAAPGGQVLLPARVLAEGVGAAAAAAAAALARAAEDPPFVAAVREAGFAGAVEVLTGAVAGPALTRAAVARLARPQPPAEADAAARLLAASGFDAAPEAALTPAARRALAAACAP